MGVAIKFTQNWKEFEEGEIYTVSPNQANKAIHEFRVAVPLQKTDDKNGNFFDQKNRMNKPQQRK